MPNRERFPNEILIASNSTNVLHIPNGEKWTMFCGYKTSNLPISVSDNIAFYDRYKMCSNCVKKQNLVKMPPMVKVKYLTANAEVAEIDVEGSILEGLEYVNKAGIKGAKIQAWGDEWIDVDSFMKAGQEMFAPVEE